MLTMPLAALLAFLLVVMCRKGGWKVLPVVTGVLFGVALASTTVGPPITDTVNHVTAATADAVAGIFKKHGESTPGTGGEAKQGGPRGTGR